MNDFFGVPMEVGAQYLVPVETRYGIEMRLCLLKAQTYIDNDEYWFKFMYKRDDGDKVVFNVKSWSTQKCVKLIPRVANEQ